MSDDTDMLIPEPVKHRGRVLCMGEIQAREAAKAFHQRMTIFRKLEEIDLESEQAGEIVNSSLLMGKEKMQGTPEPRKIRNAIGREIGAEMGVSMRFVLCAWKVVGLLDAMESKGRQEHADLIRRNIAEHGIEQTFVLIYGPPRNPQSARGRAAKWLGLKYGSNGFSRSHRRRNAIMIDMSATFWKIAQNWSLDVVHDVNGVTVPPYLVEVFESTRLRSALMAFQYWLDNCPHQDVAQGLYSLKNTTHPYLDFHALESDLTDIMSKLGDMRNRCADAMPCAICPECDASLDLYLNLGCPACRYAGYMTRQRYEEWKTWTLEE